MDQPRMRRIHLSLLVIAVLAMLLVAVGPSSSAEAIGPYWKSAGDTGVRCPTAGARVYKSTSTLTSSQQHQVALWSSAKQMRYIGYGGAAGTFQVWYRLPTYKKADLYWVCNFLHVTSTGYYYTYQRMYYKAAPITRCLTQYGYHVGGIPYVSSWSWTGSTYTGHVTSNPC